MPALYLIPVPIGNMDDIIIQIKGMTSNFFRYCFTYIITTKIWWITNNNIKRLKPSKQNARATINNIGHQT